MPQHKCATITFLAGLFLAALALGDFLAALGLATLAGEGAALAGEGAALAGDAAFLAREVALGAAALAGDLQYNQNQRGGRRKCD